MEPITLLGFDYGTRYLGVAVGQTVTAAASPLTTVSVRGGAPDWRALDELVQTWQPDLLVVGLPLTMDGDEQVLTGYARGFAKALHKRYGLRVDCADERLSSREARSRLAERGLANAPDHAVAAQIILETWFDERGLAA